ncbi:hypothetical protein K491DRAFT_718283 [Lophiostoma macrostomum CBS 122681]|uniref:Secreted protein n=1 Tax=Lophiostoma macrostomum CBS 122681 TaxID=1314788 RepID=A0A6A6T034_9PLEO|nr:hypothetical protein K491DRAFT_718283 [Lophiostoma macrostomum CBS 122681]
MSWNMWPALVVLWGVCWMFYNPNCPFVNERLDDQNINLDLLVWPTLGDQNRNGFITDRLVETGYYDFSSLPHNARGLSSMNEDDQTFWDDSFRAVDSERHPRDHSLQPTGTTLAEDTASAEGMLSVSRFSTAALDHDEASEKPSAGTVPFEETNLPEESWLNSLDELEINRLPA